MLQSRTYSTREAAVVSGIRADYIPQRVATSIGVRPVGHGYAYAFTRRDVIAMAILGQLINAAGAGRGRPRGNRPSAWTRYAIAIADLGYEPGAVLIDPAAQRCAAYGSVDDAIDAARPRWDEGRVLLLLSLTSIYAAIAELDR